MNVERMEHIRPSPRCIDNLRSDLKEHQVDPKLAQKMEEFNIAIITIGPGRDSPRTGIRSAKVHMTCRFHIYSLNWRYLQLNWRYLQLNWRYLQLICRYLQFIWRYLQIG